MAHNLSKITDSADLMYFVLLAFHPLRLEEVLGLKWADVDTAAQTVHVRRAVTHPDRNRPEVKETKTAASVRDIGLSAIALPHLIPGNPDEFVCGGKKPLSYTQVRRMMTAFADSLNLPEQSRRSASAQLY